MALQHMDRVGEDDMVVAAAVGRTLVGSSFGKPQAEGQRTMTADAACARAGQARGEDDADAARVAAAIVELRAVSAQQRPA